MSEKTDVLQGTLDLLIMRTVALEPTHGWAMTKAGRKQLAVEVSKWDRLSAGVTLVLQRT
jgi:hypothetical protein